MVNGRRNTSERERESICVREEKRERLSERVCEKEREKERVQSLTFVKARADGARDYLQANNGIGRPRNEKIVSS